MFSICHPPRSALVYGAGLELLLNSYSLVMDEFGRHVQTEPEKDGIERFLQAFRTVGNHTPNELDVAEVESDNYLT